MAWKLVAATKNYLWGGKKLKEKYVKHLPAITVLSKRTKRRIKPAEVVKLEIENKKLKDEIEFLKSLI